MRRKTGFAARLRALREAKGLTLAELADRADMHLQSLAKMEAGSREPQWGSVIALAAALRVKVTAFLPTEETATAVPTAKRAGRPKRSQRGA